MSVTTPHRQANSETNERTVNRLLDGELLDLYVAILIAGVLGKPRELGKPAQPAAAPEAEHPQVRKAASQLRLRPPRR